MCCPRGHVPDLKPPECPHSNPLSASVRPTTLMGLMIGRDDNVVVVGLARKIAILTLPRAKSACYLLCFMIAPRSRSVRAHDLMSRLSDKAKLLDGRDLIHN